MCQQVMLWFAVLSRARCGNSASHLLDLTIWDWLELDLHQLFSFYLPGLKGLEEIISCW